MRLYIINIIRLPSGVKTRKCIRMSNQHGPQHLQSQMTGYMTSEGGGLERGGWVRIVTLS